LLSDELNRTVALLAEQPHIGALLPDRRDGVRRHPMVRIRYALYYRVAGDMIEILAFWHASRGSGPPI
jgi:plasmid stabilization system protein ParE